MNEKLSEVQMARQQATDPEEQEALRRELERLEEEQRALLAEADEAMERMQEAEALADAGQARREAALGEARESVREAGEQLSEERVDQALAEGRRAEQQFRSLEEEVRGMTSQALARELGKLAEAAKQLADDQAALNREMATDRPAAAAPPTLETADQPGGQRGLEQRLEEVMESARKLGEAAQETEPLAAADLAEALRGADAARLPEQLEATRQAAEFGAPETAQRLGENAEQSLREMQTAIDRAARRVMGGEQEAMQFAKAELNELTEAIRTESGEREGSAGSAGSDRSDRSDRSAGSAGSGPIFGESFESWSDRMRELEELVPDAGVRSAIYRARDAARSMRAESRRHALPPNQALLANEVLRPLEEAEARLADRLAELQAEDHLRPVERDPVPPRFTEAVEAYYEELAR